MSIVLISAPKYQLNPLDSVQSRAICLVNNPSVTDRLMSLEDGRSSSHPHKESLCVFFRFFHRKSYEEFYDLVSFNIIIHLLPSYHSTLDHCSYLLPGSVCVPIFLPRNCKMWDKLTAAEYPDQISFYKRGLKRALLSQ